MPGRPTQWNPRPYLQPTIQMDLDLTGIIWTTTRNERGQLVLSGSFGYPHPTTCVIDRIPNAPTESSVLPIHDGADPVQPSGAHLRTTPVEPAQLDVRHSTEGTTWTDLITFSE